MKRQYWLLMLIIGIVWTTGHAADDPALDDRLRTIIATAVDSGASGRTCAMQLAEWVNTNLEYVSTDYKQRTVTEILDREAGNCADQGRVLLQLIKAAGLRSRWMAEVNIQPESDSRQKSAAAKIAERGLQMSVFGYMHNDHRWLEIYDEGSGEWFPADPTLFLVGIDDWIRHRVGFDERKEGGEGMIVPFAILARDNSKEVIDRSEYYLVDQFDRVYDGKLSTLPAWNEWKRQIKQLSAHGLAALQGEENLHDYVELMQQYKSAYLALRQQYEKLE